MFFLVQQLSQPRCLKRIEEFKDFGFNTRVFGFDNGLYNDNIKKIGIEAIWKIDKQSSKLKKILKYIELVKHVKQKITEQDILYVFGFELGMLVSFLGPKRFIYEEADISASRFTNPYVKKALINLDKRTIKKSKLTVFTSEGFEKYLFGSHNSYSRKIVYAKNKLHPSFLHKKRPEIKKIPIDSICFGFIGLIRYPNTILRFAKVVGENYPQHTFHFWGDVEGDILKSYDWVAYKNVFFHGKFKNPEDLNKVYSFIDINVVCYDTTSDNVKIAEPNKLYESIYFSKPIVVSTNTYLKERVQELNSGYSIDASRDECIIDFINNLNKNDLESIQKHCDNIPVSELVTDSKSFMEEIISRN